MPNSVFVFPNLYSTSGNANGTVLVGETDGTPHFSAFPSISTLALPTTANATSGVIYKGATPFFHYYFDPSTDGFNQFWGENAGNFTLAGMGLGPGSASYNVGAGSQVLHSLTTGYFNNGFAIEVFSELTSGHNNNGFGSKTGFHLRDGSYNTLVGNEVCVAGLHYNRVSAFGHKVLEFNTADENTAGGYQSMWANTTGTRNTGWGLHTGYTDIAANANVSGNDNCWFGYQCGPGTTTQLSGTVTIGVKAKAMKSNQAVFGGPNVTETVLMGDVLGASSIDTVAYKVGGVAGASGTGSTITSITVLNGLITDIAVS